MTNALYDPGTDPISGLGPRNTGIPGASRYHKGWDYSQPLGMPIHAAADGVVYYSGAASGYGLVVVLKHQAPTGEVFDTRYGHMDHLLPFQINQPVKKGDVIGYVGNNGISGGPHLHYEIRTWNENTALNNTVNGKGMYRSGEQKTWGVVEDPGTFDYFGMSVYNARTPGASALAPPSSHVPSGPSLPNTLLPAGNPPAGAPLQLHPGMPIPDAEGPSSVGGSNGPTPVVPAQPAPQLSPGGGLPDATGHGLYYDEPTPIPNGFPYVLPGAGQSPPPSSDISVDAQIGKEGLDGTTASPAQTLTPQAWAAGKMGATVPPASVPSPGVAPQPPTAPAIAIPPQPAPIFAPQPAPIFAPQPAVAPAPPPPAFAQIPAMQALPIFAPPRKPIDLSVLGTMIVNRPPIFPGQE
jgi:murein DD-endopeptidase MepM/ murein hydrolase activator NlpD